MTHHPMRDAVIHTFTRSDDAPGGYRAIAQFHPYAVYPVFFPGPTEEAARASAEAFRQDTLNRFEANAIKRIEALQKARAARKKKEAAE